MSTTATTHQFRTFSKLGNPADPNAGDLGRKPFEDVVKFHIARLKGDRAKAINFCVKHFPAKHQEYLSRVNNGELITF